MVENEAINRKYNHELSDVREIKEDLAGQTVRAVECYGEIRGVCTRDTRSLGREFEEARGEGIWK